jgi:hypothetical protein
MDVFLTKFSQRSTEDVTGTCDDNERERGGREIDGRVRVATSAAECGGVAGLVCTFIEAGWNYTKIILLVCKNIRLFL